MSSRRSGQRWRSETPRLESEARSREPRSLSHYIDTSGRYHPIKRRTYERRRRRSVGRTHVCGMPGIMRFAAVAYLLLYNRDADDDCGYRRHNNCYAAHYLEGKGRHAPKGNMPHFQTYLYFFFRIHRAPETDIRRGELCVPHNDGHAIRLSLFTREDITSV